MAELEQSTGVAGIQLHRSLQMANGIEPLAFQKEEAGELKMVFGVVASLVFHLVKKAAGLAHFTLEPQNAGALQLHLAGGVAGFFSLLEGFEGLIQILALE